MYIYIYTYIYIYIYITAITKYCLLVTQNIIHFRIIFVFPVSLSLKTDVQFKAEKMCFEVI